MGRFTDATEVLEGSKPMQSWKCVEVGEKDSQGHWGIAKFNVLTYEECTHNEVKKVSSEFVEICVGSTLVKSARRKGKGEGKDAKVERQKRALRELVGFFRELFEVTEEQVRLDSVTNKAKVISISGLDRDKRSLLWLLESKIGKQFEPHWATDFANAQLQANNADTLKRKREQDEFQQLKKESLESSATLPPGILPAGYSAQSGQRSRDIGRMGIRVKKAADKIEPANAPGQASAEDPDQKTTAKSAIASVTVPAEGAAASANPQADSKLAGLAGQYDSGSSEEEDSEPEKLTNPFG